jgi:hypothetical protein
VRSDEIEYHQTRAARELDMGLSTNCLNAARAHLQLSTLHFRRARELRATRENPPPQG